VAGTALGLGLAVGREFRIGSILSRSFSIYFRHFITFLLLGVAPALPDLVTDQGTQSDLTRLAILAIGLVLGPIGQAMALYGAFQDMRGRPVRLGDSVAIGLARFLPVIGVSLLTALAIGFASLLLLIPGLIMATRLFVAMPACIVERLGVSASLERSGELTKGQRWPIFALLLLTWILGTIGFSVVSAALAPIGGATAARIGGFICSALVSSFNSIVVVVVYHDLRVAKEGIDIDRIAAVFD